MPTLPWWAWIVGAVMILGLAAQMVVYGIRRAGESELAQVHADIRAAGSLVTLDEWIATLPPTDLEANRELRAALLAFMDVPDLERSGSGIDAWLTSASAPTPAVDRLVDTSSASRARLRAALADPDAHWGLAWTIPRSATARLPQEPDIPNLLACRNAATALMAAWRRDGQEHDLRAAAELPRRVGSDGLIEAMIRVAVEAVVGQSILAHGWHSRTRPQPTPLTLRGRPADRQHWTRMLRGERMMILASLVGNGIATRDGRAIPWNPDRWNEIFLPTDMAFWQRAIAHRECDPYAPEIPFPEGRWPPRVISAIVLPNTLEVAYTLHEHDAMLRARTILTDMLAALPPGADATAAAAVVGDAHPLLAPRDGGLALGIRILGPRSLRIAVRPEQDVPGLDPSRYRKVWESRRPMPRDRKGPIHQHGAAIDVDLP